MTFRISLIIIFFKNHLTCRGKSVDILKNKININMVEF
jgi:hypothetical protein